MTQTATTTETAEKFRGILDFAERERGLINRRTEMHILSVAIAAKLHVILHGNPGRAKTMTVNALLAHLPEMRKFHTQAYKASPPEQFLGPISIRAMEDDKFVRIISRKVADCDIAVLDELPRAPRAVLPALQGIMVEREFDAGDGVQPVPLQSLIGTSNHLPDDPELEAFFDRFALKLVVKAPASQQQFKDILKGALRRRDEGEPEIPDELLISRDELEQFQRDVEICVIPDDVLDAFGELWANLLAAGIEPSIRRYVDVTKAMQAVATINGRNIVEIDDMQIAQHALWTTETEIPTVYEALVAFASEWVQTKAELLDSFAETLDRLGQVQSLVAGGAETTTHVTIDDTERSITDHAIKVVNAQGKLRSMIEKHIADASAGQDVSELESALAQMDAGKAWVQDRILGGLTL